jgi:hypothetical protein
MFTSHCQVVCSSLAVHQRDFRHRTVTVSTQGCAFIPKAFPMSSHPGGKRHQECLNFTERTRGAEHQQFSREYRNPNMVHSSRIKGCKNNPLQVLFVSTGLVITLSEDLKPTQRDNVNITLSSGFLQSCGSMKMTGETNERGQRIE